MILATLRFIVALLFVVWARLFEPDDGMVEVGETLREMGFMS